ncbi:hypothetical protein pb186bvf_000934 [Paramecium bursaria]
MPSYKSVLDSAIEQAAIATAASVRKLKDEFVKDPIANLPNSSNSRWMTIANSQIQVLAQEFAKKLEQILRNINADIKNYKPEPQTHELPLKGTNGQICAREQPPQVITKELNIAKTTFNYDDEYDLRFTQFKEFIHHTKKVSHIQTLELDFKSHGLSDNNMGHFMKSFIKYYSITSLSIDLATNSLTEDGARQLAGCFTNLNQLQSLSLNLYNNKINSSGAQVLCHSLSHLLNLANLNLELASNPIGNNGLAAVGSMLDKLKKLQKVWLFLYDTGINDQGLKKFNNQIQNILPLIEFSIKISQLRIKVNTQLKENPQL